MEKRPSRIEFLFSLGFIFMLICAVGAFFYGMKLGTDRAEAKYEEKNAITSQVKKTGSYPQQDLVSFYHTVLLPYRDFQKQWFENMELLTSGDQTTDNSALLKKLSKTAKQQYDNANHIAMPASSPLLQDAQTNYLKSLKLFADGTSNWVSKANTLPGTLVANEITKDEYIQNAIKYSVTAQKQMYDSILKWSATVQTDIPAEFKPKSNVSLTEWRSYPLAVKNSAISNLLLQHRNFEPYYPHDLSAKIDQMMSSGQTEKLKLSSVDKVVDLLINTDAVRPNDFLKQKNRLYDKELLPQLPFFSE